MPDFDAWLATDTGFIGAINAAERAIIVWNRIQRNPQSIVLYRGTTPLAAQTVRITMDDIKATDRAVSEGITSEQNLVIFGVRQHPSMTETNIKDGDGFVYDGQQYEVKDVIKLPGEIQARGVRRSK